MTVTQTKEQARYEQGWLDCSRKRERKFLEGWTESERKSYSDGYSDCLREESV